MNVFFGSTDIRKAFGDQTVLRDVSLEVDKGDVIAIFGPSGSGKTTAAAVPEFPRTGGRRNADLRRGDLRSCIKRPSRADIARLRRKDGLCVSELQPLFRNKTALRQRHRRASCVARKMPKSRGRGRRHEDAGEGRPGRPGRRRIRAELSGGQQQRVAIARALASDPEIIYFDEPTSALDPELTGEVLAVMRQLAEEGMTMLVVTHEMGFARNVSSKTVFMENGVVVEQAPSHEFFANPKEERTREFLRMVDGDQEPRA